MKTALIDFEFLIANLSALVCNENLITRDEREVLVKAVATIAGIMGKNEITGMFQKPKQDSARQTAEKISDERFPRAGTPWSDDDMVILHDVIDLLPDEEIAKHVLWLSSKLGRSPYSVACKIAQTGRCSLSWRKPFKKISDDIRASGITLQQYIENMHIE